MRGGGMMKRLPNIETCVCWSGKKTKKNDWWNGLPHLEVIEGQRYIPYCPKCGRGGIIDFTSSYKALKSWNEMQHSLKHPIKWILKENKK